MSNIPYKTYLAEGEVPTSWYNLRADMKGKVPPLLDPGTGKPLGFEALSTVFTEESVRQELNDTDAYIEIPEEVQRIYTEYRPSPHGPCQEVRCRLALLRNTRRHSLAWMVLLRGL